MSEQDITRVLDAAQLSLRSMEKVTNEWPGKFHGSADALISEFNYRFREHGIGYQYTSGNIIRTDSDFTHAELVKPTLSLLREKKLATVEQEFQDAHQHYRNGENEDCLTDCGRALESMLKIILSERGVAGVDNMNANALINALFEAHVIPKHIQSQFTSLKSLLSSGTPTLRNKMAAHGQGITAQTVPESIAIYAINLTASSILLLNSYR